MKIFQRSFHFFLAAPICIGLLFAATAELCAQSEFVAYNFPFVRESGVANCGPEGNLVADSGGNFYGTASICDTQDPTQQDTVYKLSRPVPPSKAWAKTTLYTFSGGSDGAGPMAGVIFDKAGNLYGTTNMGGTFGFGTVFQLSPPAIAGDRWTESILYNFKGAPDGESPQNSGVVFDPEGNLYGATFRGGVGTACCGVVYQMKPPLVPGGVWTETVIHRFAASFRGFPAGILVLDAKANLYGGYDGFPSFVFRLSPPASGGSVWGFRMLYTFPNQEFVSSPGSLTFHGDGALYLMADNGVVELVPPAEPEGAWVQNILHTFGSIEGTNPVWGIIFDKAGNLYGVNQYGGIMGQFGNPCFDDGCGSIFELSPPSSGTGAWTETTLHLFGSGFDGVRPTSAPFLYPNGVLYGVTQSGGKAGSGVLYGVVK